MDIREFLRDRYSAFPLMLATERAIPGMLLETDWHRDFPLFWIEYPEFRREEGFAWDLLGTRKALYESQIVDANIIQESINGRVSLGGQVSLPQYGISSGAELSSDLSVIFKVTGVKARVFKNTGSPYELMQGLLELKKSEPNLWDWVNDDFVISESYYVASFTAQFKGKKGISAKAEFQRAGQTTTGDVKLNWTSDSTLEMVGTPSVPIAVRGLRI